MFTAQLSPDSGKVQLRRTEQNVQQQKISDSERRQALVSFLARLLQTIRVDNNEAPVLAAKITLDYLLDYGGVVIDEASGRFAIDFDRIDMRAALFFCRFV